MFSDLPLHPRLQKGLDQAEFTTPTPVQAACLTPALAGRDLLVEAATGSGKTAAFLIPVIQLCLAKPSPRSGTRAVILVPTRELALQTEAAFARLGAFTFVTATVIMGGESFSQQLAKLRKNPEIVIATPGRLLEHLTEKSFDLADLEWLILDEADRMLDLGFSESLAAIASHCNPERNTWLFSATLGHPKLGPIASQLQNPERIALNQTPDSQPNIVQERILADDDAHKTTLVTRLLELEQAPRAMVFCKTRDLCQRLAGSLRGHKIKAGYLHSELTQDQRKQVLQQFRSGHLSVLVATDLAARGLDIDAVELVINYNVAQSGDDHVHRIGRTGRKGESGKAITLVNHLDWNLMASIERYLGIQPQKRELADLKATYKGPSKVKNSGKAAGHKTKKPSSSNGLSAKKPAKKPRAPRAPGSADGTAPLTRKPRP